MDYEPVLTKGWQSKLLPNGRCNYPTLANIPQDILLSYKEWKCGMGAKRNITGQNKPCMSICKTLLKGFKDRSWEIHLAK